MQNSHRFLLESLRPLNPSDPGSSWSMYGYINYPAVPREVGTDILIILVPHEVCTDILIIMVSHEVVNCWLSWVPEGGIYFNYSSS